MVALSKWKYNHSRLIDIAMILTSGFQTPAYVLLWIINEIEPFGSFQEYKKMHVIWGVLSSLEKIEQQRKLAELKTEE